MLLMLTVAAIKIVRQSNLFNARLATTRWYYQSQSADGKIPALLCPRPHVSS